MAICYLSGSPGESRIQFRLTTNNAIRVGCDLARDAKFCNLQEISRRGESRREEEKKLSAACMKIRDEAH